MYEIGVLTRNGLQYQMKLIKDCPMRYFLMKPTSRSRITSTFLMKGTSHAYILMIFIPVKTSWMTSSRLSFSAIWLFLSWITEKRMILFVIVKRTTINQFVIMRRIYWILQTWYLETALLKATVAGIDATMTARPAREAGPRKYQMTMMEVIIRTRPPQSKVENDTNW